ncbi:hypothetical protein CCP3SC5AM1_720013 [Gammaproteobacteria bacterium]
MKNISYIKRGPYQLMVSFSIYINILIDKDINYRGASLSSTGTLTIYEGFLWDGPTGYPFHDNDFMRPSLIHDALYLFIRDGYLSINNRKEADLLFYKLCLEDGMNKWKAMFIYFLIRIVGGYAIENDAGRNGHDLDVMYSPPI